MAKIEKEHCKNRVLAKGSPDLMCVHTVIHTMNLMNAYCVNF